MLHSGGLDDGPGHVFRMASADELRVVDAEESHQGVPSGTLEQGASKNSLLFASFVADPAEDDIFNPVSGQGISAVAAEEGENAPGGGAAAAGAVAPGEIPSSSAGKPAPVGRPRYIQCRSDAHLHAVLARKQRGFNRKNPEKKLEMVLFDAARQHVCRVARVLAQPRGHCLLCGLDGSGRRSVTRLAAFAQGCDLIEPDISSSSNYSIQDWREDLKNALLQSGLQGKQIAMVVLES